jgi:hypothetical protein
MRMLYHWSQYDWEQNLASTKQFYVPWEKVADISQGLHHTTFFIIYIDVSASCDTLRTDTKYSITMSQEKNIPFGLEGEVVAKYRCEPSQLDFFFTNADTSDVAVVTAETGLIDIFLRFVDVDNEGSNPENW